MVRDDKIQAQLLGLVGWNRPTTTGYDIVDSANLGSTSGLKFDDASFLVSIKNIKDNQEDIDIIDAEFNTLLANMQKGVISDVVKKVTFGESDHLQSINLYPFEKTFTDILETSDRFVGFRIEPRHALNKLAVVSQIELAFDSAKTFDIYLFNSNLKAAIKTQPVTTVADQSVIQDIEWYLADDVAYKGGNFYVGYFENDLGAAKPYQRNHDLASFRLETQCFYIDAGSIQHTNEVLDISSFTNLTDTGGLNLILNVYKDYTELVIRNKNKFAYAIQQSMAIKVLDLIKNSMRTNSTESRTNENIEKIMTEIYGFKTEHVYVQGLTSKVNRAIADLRKDFFYQPVISKATVR